MEFYDCFYFEHVTINSWLAQQYDELITVPHKMSKVNQWDFERSADDFLQQIKDSMGLFGFLKLLYFWLS